MFCPIGVELFEHYQNAETEKNALRARRDDLTKDMPLVSDKEFQAAKQRYVEKFADWLGHKAFCQDCKPKAPEKGEQHSTAPGR